MKVLFPQEIFAPFMIDIMFRRMISRGRQRKIPLEKIQTEISSVRGEQSNDEL